jgi:uncharacterized protein (TIGR02099 family)
VILRAFDFLSRIVLSAFVVLIVLLALYVSLGRYYVPLLGNYREVIVEQLTEMTGLNFRFSALRGEWQRFSPVIHIEDFTLLGSARGETEISPLLIPELKIALDVFASLEQGAPRLKSLRLQDAVLAFEQSAQGHWTLQGMTLAASVDKPAKPKKADGKLHTLVNLLLNISKLEIGNAQIALQFHDGRSVLLDALNINLNNSGNFRRLQVSTQTGAGKSALLAVVEGEGDPRDPQSMQIHAYSKLAELDLADYLRFSGRGFELQELQLSGEFWLAWQQRTGLALQGKLALPALKLWKNGSSIWSARELTGEFLAERDTDGQWQAWIPRLQAAQQVPLDKTYIRTEKLSDGSVVELEAKSLAVAPVIKVLLASGLLNEKLQEVLGTLNPVGVLGNIQLTLPLSASAKENFQVRTELKNLATDAWHGAPGSRNVNGFLQAGIFQGFVDLQTPKLSLLFPKVYDHWLEFENVDAQVSWQLDDERVIVSSDLIKLQGKGDAGLARGALYLDLPRKPGEDPPLMTLEIGLQDTPVRVRQRYIPSLLSAELRSWLERSIDNTVGSIPTAGFIFHGPLAKGGDAPSIQLFANVEQAGLEFHRDWPALHELDALVLIENHLSDIEVFAGKIYNSNLEPTKIHLEPDERGGLQLDINGAVNGSLGDGLRIIKESPIYKGLGNFADNWSAKGPMRAELDLSIPLGDKSEKGAEREPQIAVDVQLQGALLVLGEQHLQFDRLQGNVTYDSQTGLQAQSLNAHFWGKPAKASISSSEKAGGRATQISLAGIASSQHLLEWTRQPALVFFKGSSAFDAQLLIDPQAENYLAVKSDLDGIAIDLPQPFGKPAKDKRVLNYRQGLQGPVHLQQIALAQQLQLSFINSDDSLAGALIHIGATPQQAEQTGKLEVNGELDEFDLSLWLPVLERYIEADKIWRKSNDASAAEKEPGENTVDKDRANSELPIIVDGVKIDTFYAFGKSLRELTVDVIHDQDHWRVALECATLKGNVDIFDDQRPYKIALDYLHLNDLLAVTALQGDDQAMQDTAAEVFPEQKQAATVPEEALTVSGETDGLLGVTSSQKDLDQRDSLHPKDIPALDFSVQKLYQLQENYGSWSMQLRPLSDGVSVQQLKADVKSLHLDGANGGGATLTWRRPQGSDQDFTRFAGTASTRDIGDVLEDWGYERMMKSKSAHFQIDGQWLGGPADLSLQSIDGRMHLNLKEGNFINASGSTSNALKVVSFLNLDKLVRRLQLDFSDLAGEGLNFDRIRGDVKSKNGVMSTDKRIEVKGSSSEFRIAGSLDFARRTIDSEMVVILPLGSNLPWLAAALAGGLPAAASVYLASKVLKKQVDVLSSAVYSISGGWDNPEVKFVKLFDSTPEMKKTPDSAQAGTNQNGSSNDQSGSTAAGQ